MDFTQVQRAEVVGCFSGHLHRDALAQVGALHVAVTTCDADLSYDPEEEPVSYTHLIPHFRKFGKVPPPVFSPVLPQRKNLSLIHI